MSDTDWETGSEESWPSDEGASATTEAAADQPFCYVSSAWATPNVTIYASSRDAADGKAPSGTTYCHDGSCMYEGKFEPIEEGCG
jgi:hypothetical protein